MIKRFLFFLIACVVSFNVNAQQVVVAEEEDILPDKIYFFAHSLCNDCKDAYVYLSTYHSNLSIPIFDMKNRNNFELYKKCVKKFDIDNKMLTLPLICMGNNYIMGWKDIDKVVFRKYLKEF